MTVTKSKLKEHIDNNKLDIVIGFLQSKGYNMEKFMLIIDFKIKDLEVIKRGTSLSREAYKEKKRIIYGEGEDTGLVGELLTLIDVYFDEAQDDKALD